MRKRKFFCEKLAEMKKETIKEFKKALPTGWSRIVTERLAEKGIKTTPRNVQYVANGATSNPDIEKELLELLTNPPEKKEKKKKEKSEFENKILEILAEKKKPLAD